MSHLTGVIEVPSPNSGSASVQVVALGISQATLIASAERIPGGPFVIQSISLTADQAPVTKLALTPASINAPAGQTYQLVLQGLDAQGNLEPVGAITWNSSSPGVASVTGWPGLGNTGEVQTLTPGISTITATVGTLSANASITVTDGTFTITASPNPLTISTPVTVGNSINSQITITAGSVGGSFNYNISGANVGDFSASGCAVSLAAGGTCNVTVIFTPSASGTRSATLNFTNFNGGGALLSVPLWGTGQNPAFTITASPNPLTISTPVTVGNSFNSQITITAGSVGGSFNCNISGANVGDFSASGCAVSLSPNATCNVTVTFQPTAGGTRIASLNFTNSTGGAALLSVPLFGTGQNAVFTISASPDPLNFSTPVTVGNSTSSQLTITSGPIGGSFFKCTAP
jgi:hypothetical protein